MNTIDSTDSLLGLKAPLLLLLICKLNPQIGKVGFYIYSEGPNQPISISEDSLIWLSREEIVHRNALSDFTSSLSSDNEMGVFSRVSLVSGKSAHIPMMDFRIPKEQEALALIIRRLYEVGSKISGWLLDSGVSYHFYGEKLLTHRAWYSFMGKCLLTSVKNDFGDYVEIADCRYVGHSLIQRGNLLRVSARSGRKPMPVVISELKS